jgi:hypothetical protein
MLLTASTADATIIVNLSASPSSPNAGPNSGSYTLNPVGVYLAAGTYSVGVVGIARGGAYDAYTVYAPSPTNGAYTAGQWSLTEQSGPTLTQAATVRFNTSAEALNYYSALVPLFFTLPEPETVAFYLDDTVFPYFADDSGGVSLGIAGIGIPEPGALAVLGIGLAGLAAARGVLRGRTGRTNGRRPDQHAEPPDAAVRVVNALRSSP